MQKYALKKIISFVKLAVLLKQGKAKCDILLQLRYMHLTDRRKIGESFLSFHGSTESGVQKGPHQRNEKQVTPVMAAELCKEGPPQTW